MFSRDLETNLNGRNIRCKNFSVKGMIELKIPSDSWHLYVTKLFGNNLMYQYLHCRTGIYRLTPNYGLNYIASCNKTGFHPHPKEPPLFEVIS